MSEFEMYQQKYTRLLPELGERARRLVVAADAKMRGHGGSMFIHKASRLSLPTIRKGIRELSASVTLGEGRDRIQGGGRKKITETDPTLVPDLMSLVETTAEGDPESVLQWTNKSVRALSKELKEKEHTVSHTKTRALLKDNNYRLQQNKKTKEGMDHPDRNQQFQHINEKATRYLAAGNPVISVDTKKKELVGTYKNNGQRWLPKGKPIEVNGHDFPDKKLGKAAPYGVYDVSRNEGYVNVGISNG